MIKVWNLEVGGVVSEMLLHTHAQLIHPLPLGLQGCAVRLRKTQNKKFFFFFKTKKSQNFIRVKLQTLPPRSVWPGDSPDTDERPFPAATASPLASRPVLTSFPVDGNTRTNQDEVFHPSSTSSTTNTGHLILFFFSNTHVVQLSLGVDAGVSFAPVVGDLLLLPLVEPDQLLGAVRDE